ncbi:uncharacterized protein LOC125863777 [Solanum stenotomum]|uniref:uncharacterized protein LOC125863777 n=1 Tax=Solanum stenotomum TaxID=172797 RepID=UPI0020D1C85A|nr:uncharacterized protein LOC125863777 [Solanum stenotomum]
MGREKRACQGKQHFSHPHILKPIVNPTETLTCNACEQPNITSNFYGCNTCQYYLHQNCLNAPRFLDHSSHPSHHLTLLPTPTYSNRSYTCKACASAGNGFSFSCARCEFDVHMHCALLPQTVFLSQHHHHDLVLIFESPFYDDADDESTVFVCDLCRDNVDLNNWFYYCADCDFGTHLECAISKSVSQQERPKLLGNKPRENPVVIRKTEEVPIKNEKEINQEEEAEEEEENSNEMGRGKQTCQGKQHFSHPHILKPIVNPTETLTCNACEQPNITSNFYGCTTCQYYLHENCLNAPRFLHHSSHPSHHLTLLPVPTYSNRSYTCKACGSAGNGCSFSCACCDFDIHMQCALLPQTVVLPQQHHHELELIFESPYDDDADENTVFVCDVCHDNADLNNWLYYCADCDFGTHLKCAISKSVRQQEPKQRKRRGTNQDT